MVRSTDVATSSIDRAVVWMHQVSKPLRSSTSATSTARSSWTDDPRPRLEHGRFAAEAAACSSSGSVRNRPTVTRGPPVRPTSGPRTGSTTPETIKQARSGSSEVPASGRRRCAPSTGVDPVSLPPAASTSPAGRHQRTQGRHLCVAGAHRSPTPPLSSRPGGPVTHKIGIIGLRPSPCPSQGAANSRPTDCQPFSKSSTSRPATHCPLPPAVRRLMKAASARSATALRRFGAW